MADDRVELHKRFYYNERVLVKEMNALQLREHIETLQMILFEAKARVSASMDEERERKAKLSSSQRDNLITTPDLSISDALKDIKQRQKRMSKADKLQALIAGLTDEETASKLIKNVQAKTLDNVNLSNGKRKVQTESALCLDSRHDDCVGRFRTENGSYVCKCECHTKPKVNPDAPKFDPSALFKK
jgi:hypothetical protein